MFGGDLSYDSWKSEIKAWRLTTPLEKNKQALTIALSLPVGSEVRRRIFDESGDIEELNCVDGVDILITRLDKWYKKDNLSAAYDAWTKFDNCKKAGDTTMDEYISEFRRRNNDLKKYKVSIPNCILAFKMLDNANLDVKEKQIALTAVSYDDETVMLDLMEQSLKKFFGSQEVFAMKKSAVSVSDSTASSQSVIIKSESVCNTEEVNIANRGRGMYRGQMGRRGRARGGSYGRGTWRGGYQKYSSSTEKNSYGRRCYICGSEYHLASGCPQNTYLNEATEEREEESMINSCSEVGEMAFAVNSTNQLIHENINYAVLDSACTSTVCGEEWLNLYIEGLTKKSKSEVREYSSQSTFRFGSGKIYKSLKKMSLPVKIAGKDERILTDLTQ